MQSVGGEARKMCIIKAFLLRVPDDMAEDRSRSSGADPHPKIIAYVPEAVK